LSYRPIPLPRIGAWISPVLVVAALGCTSSSNESGVERGDPIPEPASGHPGFASPQVQSIALSPTQPEVYVTNTAADTLDILDAESREVVYRVRTGIDPVSVAVRPDGSEVWVSNHLSDSVSIIDVDPQSPTRYRLVGTVQALDESGLVTDFDEPTGIAFADDTKAYVALSSRNRIAVVDVASRAVTDQIQVWAQEPRALTVANGRLYVVPFESTNQTEISGCFAQSEEPDCTFDIFEVLLTNSIDAIITRGFDANIVRQRRVPDRDLFIYDTATEEALQEVSTIGTLLYGVAVDSRGRIFISQTEARNDANGDMVAGDDLIDLENRMFLNQIARLNCAGECTDLELIELEPVPPEHPAPGAALATPYGIEVSADDRVVVSVASGSSTLFTMDADTGAVLGRVAVGAIPKALALESDENGAPLRAWVFNAIEDSVSVVDVSDPSAPVELERVALDDPTDPVVKRGRIAFNNANGSTTGTFSCESCHPDGNTDQLLWNLGAVCFTEGCNQTIPRTTMPIRGLRDTLPLHWDGVPGDPFGGINSEVNDMVDEEGNPVNVEPTCTDEHSCFRDLVDGAMSGTMCDLANCPTDLNEAGLAGAFDEADRDALAEFLKTVPYPPARSRKLDDTLSDLAWDGFRAFLIGNPWNPQEGDDFGAGCSRASGSAVPACHSAPFWAGTNTPRQGMDAPTFRGLTDRHLLLPNGRAGMWELISTTTLNEVPWDPNNGPDELYSGGMTCGTSELPISNRNSLRGMGPFELFQLFEETSTGFSGAFGRQITIDATSATDAQAANTNAFLDYLEGADSDGVVDLRGNGTGSDGAEVVLLFDDGIYNVLDEDGDVETGLTRGELLQLALAGEVNVTLTARIGDRLPPAFAQPGIWMDRALDEPMRRQFLAELPKVSEDKTTIDMYGRHVQDGAIVLVDGAAVNAEVTCAVGGELPACDGEAIRISLASIPAVGQHTLQVVTPGGLTSNEVMLISE